jgi:hypothetical protein
MQRSLGETGVASFYVRASLCVDTLDSTPKLYSSKQCPIKYYLKYQNELQRSLKKCFIMRLSLSTPIRLRQTLAGTNSLKEDWSLVSSFSSSLFSSSPFSLTPKIPQHRPGDRTRTHPNHLDEQSCQQSSI